MSDQLELAGRPVAADAPPPTSTVRRALIDVTPFCVGIVPFGLAIGHASAAAGFTMGETLFGALALMAGSSQLAAIETLDTGGGILLTATVVALINVRFALYGAGVSQWFQTLQIRQRLLLVIPVVDQSFILCQEHFDTEHDPGRRQTYFLTVSAALVATFVVCQLIAHRLGTSIPDALGLEMAAPLAFAGMLAKAANGRATMAAASVAAVIVVAATIPLGSLALPLAVALGVGAALGVER
jgi:predicted branched-subunit amino acid permease